MSSTFEIIQRLVCEGEVRISEHGYDELSADGILAREIVEGISEAILVEEYPSYPKGPVDEAYKLDKVRESLRQGDIKTALEYGPVFTLTPVSS